MNGAMMRMKNMDMQREKVVFQRALKLAKSLILKTLPRQNLKKKKKRNTLLKKFVTKELTKMEKLNTS